MVVASDHHRASPPGWIGIIEICSSVVVACPAASANWVADRLAGLTPAQLIQPSTVDARLNPVDTLGPALLFYGRETTMATEMAGTVVGPLGIGDARVQSVIEDATDHERDEAGIEDTTSGVYVGRDSGGCVCLAGVAATGCTHLRAHRRLTSRLRVRRPDCQRRAR
jgi:hypothetical protein